MLPAVSATPEPEPQEWYEALPERLEWELADFVARGLPAQAEVASNGRMRITTSLPFDGEPVEILVVFPHEYPDVEPTVYGPPGLVGRHQTRVVGNFCLLEDPRLDWWPTMSAAGLVDEDLRWLLEDSAAGATAVAAGEADMPEPLSQHVAVDNSGIALFELAPVYPALGVEPWHLVAIVEGGLAQAKWAVEQLYATLKVEPAYERATVWPASRYW